MAAVAILGATAFLTTRRWPAILAAALSYAALVAPNLGAIVYDLMLVSDRYSYLATMPLFVVVGAGLVRWLTVSQRPWTIALVISLLGWGLVGVCIVLTRTQCTTWRNSETLVAHGLRVGSGRDGLLESNFGLDLLAMGRVDDGMAHLFKAIRVDPADPDVHENVGITLLKRGELDGAIVHLAEAVRLAPHRFDLRHHLGLALAQRGRLKEAAEELATTVRLRRDKAQVYISYGDVLTALGRYDEAALQYGEAVRLEPGNPSAVHGLNELQRPGKKP
jgi:tetratricopeptide (TPR) repeat protein